MIFGLPTAVTLTLLLSVVVLFAGGIAYGLRFEPLREVDDAVVDIQRDTSPETLPEES